MPDHGIILAWQDPFSQVKTRSFLTVSDKSSTFTVLSFLEASSTRTEHGGRRPTTPNRAMPSELSSMTIWEINYQLARLKVRHVMVKRVISVTKDDTVEEGARIMIDRKIGSLLVMRDGKLTGIVTDIDMMGALSSLMGWRQPGVRVTVQVPDEKGQLARVASAIAGAGGLLAGGGSYPAAEPLKANIVFKVRMVPFDQLVALLGGMENVEILDIRDSLRQA
jgi:acetoin utilization protein AcuB